MPTSHQSTLAHVLSGHTGYQVEEGTVAMDGHDVLSMRPEERAWRGLFVGFQYPVEIPGVDGHRFIQAAIEAKRKYHGQPSLHKKDFDRLLSQHASSLGMDVGFTQRSVNEGFSGGEKKRNELLQMLMLEPSLVILDEIDSGLDVDALAAVSKAINEYRSPTRAIVLITHYERLLSLVKVDQVHIMHHGKIVATGGQELADRVHSHGFAPFTEE